ncbi:hypothetical protein [Segeticoccus rhizosphaerae]|uniref:hypothetical protein n=1 Tax=Segeticoccus rhizosphaerae TaxID=1104777 RepID=UPI0012648FBD|nr:hypothetical protein [Segeticoccus rhizosphaerae]
MTRVTDWLSTHRHTALAMVIVMLTALLALAAVVSHRATHHQASSPAAPATTEPARPAPSSGHTAPQADPHSKASPLSREDRSALTGSLQWLRSMQPVTAKRTSGQPVISAQDRSQPDLYAAALVRGLLTQDYATPRSNLLAWVQSQAAATAEPSVVGLVPKELRPKLAVASVQEGFDGPGPVPAPGVWDTLAARHGHTTVQIQRVTEPVTWSAALANGQISDPGITAREVDAQVTLHTRQNGHQHTSVTSVALTINLEGPPTRRHYGLVLLVDYTTKPVTSS